jgi:predicted metalloprotease
MRWDSGHVSKNVFDQRGMRGMRVPRGGVRLGIGGLIVVGVLSLLLGRDLLTPLTNGGGAPSYAPGGAQTSSPGDEELVHFVSFVLDDCQSTWRQIFAQRGQTYRDAQLVLYTSYVSTACGDADSGTGPFYCPADQHVYIDLSFYRELRDRFGAPGDFAQAYVLAHEIGHHVQHLSGTEARVQQQVSQRPGSARDLSVRTELQADCYAGVWARSTAQRQLLDPGDVEEAMRAAQAVGDDTLQRQSGRTVRPDTFTHGSALERTAWFNQGYTAEGMDGCDTFAVATR